MNSLISKCLTPSLKPLQSVRNASERNGRASGLRRAVGPFRLSYYSIQPLVPVSRDVNPIVLCHGLLATKDIWQPIVKPLALETCRSVYAVDLRNHGDSPHADVPESGTKSMALDVAFFMEEMNIEKAVFVGYGLGAHVVMEMASFVPERVEKLIVVDLSEVSIPGINLRLTKKLIDIMRSVVNRQRPGDSLDRSRAKLYLSLIPLIEDDHLIRFLISKLAIDEKHHLFWKFNLLGIKDLINSHSMTNINTSLPFSGEALFINGKPIRLLRREYSVVRKLFPLRQYRCIKAQHFVQTEEPKKFVKSVVDFIGDNE